MEEVRPYSVTRHGEKKIFIFKERESSPYVFLRYDTIGGPLQPQYDETFEVGIQDEKNYIIKINNSDVTVSMDRLKPTFIVSNDLAEKVAESRDVLIPIGQMNTRDKKTVQATIEHRKKTAGAAGTLRDWLQASFG